MLATTDVGIRWYKCFPSIVITFIFLFIFLEIMSRKNVNCPLVIKPSGITHFAIFITSYNKDIFVVDLYRKSEGFTYVLFALCSHTSRITLFPIYFTFQNRRRIFIYLFIVALYRKSEGFTYVSLCSFFAHWI